MEESDTRQDGTFPKPMKAVGATWVDQKGIAGGNNEAFRRSWRPNNTVRKGREMKGLKNVGSSYKVIKSVWAEKRRRAEGIWTKIYKFTNCARRGGRVKEEVLQNFGKWKLVKPCIEPKSRTVAITNGHMEQRFNSGDDLNHSRPKRRGFPVWWTVKD